MLNYLYEKVRSNSFTENKPAIFWSKRCFYERKYLFIYLFI